MDELAYSAALSVCAFFRESEKVRRVLRMFDIPSGDAQALMNFVFETNPDMTVAELWPIAMHYKPNFIPQRGGIR